MSDAIVLGGFLAAATAVTVGWGRALWYVSERSTVLRRWSFLALGRTHRTPGEVRALLLTAIYYSLGLLAALLFTAAFQLPFLAIARFGADDVTWVILGAIGEISLSSLLVELGVRATGNRAPGRFAEIQEIPWMKGLRQLPPAMVPVVAALAGAVEETFYRGVLLGILIMKLSVPPMAAVAISGTLFCVEQLLQVRTSFQAMIIASGCVAISVVGGLLVVARGSFVPAALCHASFVLFFMNQGSQRKRAGTRAVTT